MKLLRISPMASRLKLVGMSDVNRGGSYLSVD